MSLRRLATAFVFVGLFLIAWSPIAQAVNINDVQINRIDWNGFSSEYGEVILDLTLSGSLEFLNVEADLDGSGFFSDYAVGPDFQTEWIGRNVELPPAAGANHVISLTFPLIDPAVTPGASIDIVVTFDLVPQPPPGAGPTFTRSMGTGFRHNPGAGKEQSIAGLPPDPATGPGGFNDQFQAVNNLGLNLTDFKFHFNVPDNTQPDDVTCGPTSAANSLRWLANEHGFADKLPATDADLINDLKGAGYMMTGASGTTDPKFVTGKRQYIIDKKLPVVQKFKDGNTTILGQAQEKPDRTFIWDELRAGEDIELGFTYTGGNGGGHWVTLVGGAKWSDDTAYIYINDPADGVNGAQRYQLKLRGDGFLEIVGYGSGNFIDIVVSESFDDVVPGEPSTWGRLKVRYR